MGKGLDNVMRLAALGLFAVTAGIVWIGVTTKNDGPAAVASRDAQCSEGVAFVMSQNFVKRDLRAPATAQFPHQPISATEIGECQFRVSSYVDAQNAFGALIRSNYSVDMKFNASGRTWSAANLSISE